MALFSEYFIMHDKGVDPRAAVEGHDHNGDAKIMHEYTL
jgi:hypothetical protein